MAVFGSLVNEGDHMEVQGVTWLKMIPLSIVVEGAAGLMSEDGENPEYDRAMVELVRDLLGIDSDHDEAVEMMLRVWNG